MKTFKFNNNWNDKMICNNFTTLRPYYPNNSPNTSEIVVCTWKEIVFHCEVVSVVKFPKIEDVPDFIFYLDLGYCKTESLKIIENMFKQYIDIYNHTWALFTLKQRPEITKKINEAEKN